MTRTPDRVLQAAVRAHLLELAEQAEQRPTVPPSTRPRTRPRDVARLAVATLVVAATGVAGWAAIATVAQLHRTTEPAVSPSSSASPTPEADTSDPVADGLRDVVGRGRLTGPITGDFTITHDDRGPTLHLSHLDVGSSTARQVLVSVDLASATCRADRVGTLAGRIGSGRTQDVILQDPSPQDLSDLSYMHAIAIWPSGGCISDEVSAGTITWTLPPAIRTLAEVDLGARAGATGAVTETKGRPDRYEVAAGDRLAEVAARFDVTRRDLLYLNPLRQRGDSATLYTGEVLNLDPLDRDWFSS